MTGVVGSCHRAAAAGLALAALPLLVGCSQPGGVDGPEYPEARREARVTVYHDIQVSDPYRWLENPDSAETRDWLGAQQRLTRARLPKPAGNPAAENFTRQLAALRSVVRAGVPQLGNGRYAYFRQDGHDGPVEIWLTLDPEEAGRPLVAAGDLPDQARLGDFALSPDGALLAWSFRQAGEGAWRWRIRDTQTAADAEAELAGTGSVSWGADSRGLFYAREPVAAGDGATVSPGLWYHRAGAPQARDVQVYGGNIPAGVRVSPRVTDDGRYLLVELADGSGSTAIHYQRLGRTPARGRVIRLLDGWDAEYRFAGSTERTFYFLTSADAPLRRVVAVDLDRPDPGDWRVVIPEGESPLAEALLVGGRLALAYRDPARSRLLIHDLAGQHIREVELTETGFAGLLSGGDGGPGLLYAWTDRQQAPVARRHDVNSGGDGTLMLAAVPDTGRRLRIERLDRPGDGMPLTLVRPDVPDGRSGALLVTVGTGHARALPDWQPEALAWTSVGGSWAIVEPAPDTSQAVTELLRTIDWLTAEGLAQSGQLAIEASGRGALIAAAAINRRPELFTAALLRAAPLDLLRAAAPGDDHGDPGDPDAFAALLALSPYHQLQAEQCYPATLVIASGELDSVPGWQARKYLAALQAVQACDQPVLLDTSAGPAAWQFLASRAGLLGLPDPP